MGLTMTDFLRPPIIPLPVLDCFRQAEKVLLLCHYNPDGDAIGASVGLAAAIRARGRKADLHLVGAYSDNLAYLLAGMKATDGLADPGSYDLLVLLDCHSFDRLGDDGPRLAAFLETYGPNPPLAVIDHHLTAAGETAGPTWLLDETASSTGELVFYLLKALGWTLPPQSVEALLAAIASDTGFFSQTNATAGALAAAAELTAAGGRLEAIKQRLKMSRPPRCLRLLGRVLNSLSLHYGNRLAVMEVTGDMLALTGAAMVDTEDFVELGRTIDGVVMSALIKDQGPGAIKISLRSREPADVAALAALFGGGGHRQAAAYTDLEAVNAAGAKARLLSAAERFL
ncbi:MAG: bifunctional oligoribonuclease/PAP phosphatase NrnA [Candidatus Adiutrix sp.]|jgi:phosphoesterase RecJ-like protein|nr:bifunctional oligoribonuclease/PAP phosphatase NrnA [Candidatus Adiutrix sp.]